ncbi:hypothetical protein Tco_0297660, partial [Tanacetum coccineum]
MDKFDYLLSVVQLMYMLSIFDNGTVDDVKKIVATLNAGDIPSTDVV